MQLLAVICECEGSYVSGCLQVNVCSYMGRHSAWPVAWNVAGFVAMLIPELMSGGPLLCHDASRQAR